MKAAFYTLGCKVNQYETAAIQRQFAADGFQIVGWDEPADVYVVNSCTVTATGDRKSRQMLRRAKRRNPGAVAVLCGCFPQAFPDEAQGVVEADIVLGSKNRGALLHTVKGLLEARDTGRVVDIPPHRRGEIFEPLRTAGQEDRTRAFVKIQDGCERCCAYCIIPKARGAVRSKSLKDLEAELEGLARAGYREAVLVGINLSSYGVDLGLRLLDAVALCCGVPGISRVRLGSLEPELLTGPDIGALALLPGLCPQFHLSLQSGSDTVLQRMRRHYDTGEYRRIVGDLRRAFPGCAVTTDIMVGFPGETQEEFGRSLEFVEEIGFARVHVFAYSRRPGTAADTMPGQIDEGEKALRARRMADVAGAAALAYWRAQLGGVVEVLFERQLPGGIWEGYSETYTPVRVASADAALSGQIRPVRLSAVEGDHCRGELLI